MGALGLSLGALWGALGLPKAHHGGGEQVGSMLSASPEICMMSWRIGGMERLASDITILKTEASLSTPRHQNVKINLEDSRGEGGKP